ncbi:hypothetical protein P4A93_12280 [Pseudomonas syringae pv. syringae]|uniref:hypothetical protein n=1 Tax=Pseudomonas syringae TaxID=317 RepID=UPI0023F7CE19|nr:hypothetical protein [Pseudomonas syringae]MDF5892404.1 hypothetical protein [Pseudomonas syringae pv. syringae]
MATSSKDDYDPILAGNIVQATKAKQRSFDATNTSAQYLPKPAQATPASAPSPAGPVGRATQQLASQTTDRPLSLADAAPRQTSFDATNTPARYMPASQSAGQGLAAASAAPVSRQPSLRDAFPTGIGDGRSAIYGGIGANGEASFSNTASTLNSLQSNFTAPSQPPAQRFTSLAQTDPQPGRPITRLEDLAPGIRSTSTGTMGQPTSPGAMSLPATGSAANMGDGIGTFSQANAGDGQLAMDRFARAANIREAGRDRDRLDLANAKLTRDSNFTVVADSSRRPTLADMRFDQQRQLDTQGMQEAVKGAQGQIDNRRQGQAADLQLRQATRLEDIMTAGTAPNATLQQQQALQRALDPDGSKALSRQQTLANIDKTTAEADKARREASATGVKLTESQSKDLNYFGRGNSSNDRLEDQSSALTASASGERGALRGLADTAIRSIPFVGDSSLANSMVSKERQQAEQSGREFVSAILRKDSGAAITNQEMETYGKMFLAQPGDSDQVIAQKHESRVTALQGIRDGLGTAEILAAPLGRPADRPNRPQQQQPAQNAQPAPAQAPIYRISTEEQFARLPSGANFIDPQGNHRRKP